MSDLKYIDVKEAAALMGRHPSTIRGYIRGGLLTRRISPDRSHAYQIDPTELSRLPRAMNFWDQVDKDGARCWLWTGRLLKGYGIFNGKLAHRLSYEKLIGAIPDGLEIDHLCLVPRCVNPEHLEPVTRLVNMRRRFDLLTHCKNGHEFSAENTYLYKGYYRQCRTCNLEARRRYLDKKIATS